MCSKRFVFAMWLMLFSSDISQVYYIASRGVMLLTGLDNMKVLGITELLHGIAIEQYRLLHSHQASRGQTGNINKAVQTLALS